MTKTGTEQRRRYLMAMGASKCGIFINTTKTTG
jgi:hypothetical protein